MCLMRKYERKYSGKRKVQKSNKKTTMKHGLIVHNLTAFARGKKTEVQFNNDLLSNNKLKKIL